MIVLLNTVLINILIHSLIVVHCRVILRIQYYLLGDTLHAPQINLPPIRRARRGSNDPS
jgi:hypothetical protein